MKFASLLCGFVLFFSSHIQAQKTSIDSLQQAFRTAKEDTVKVMVLYQIGEQFEEVNPDTALWYFDQAKRKAEQINFLKGRAEYASKAIVILNNRGKFKEALAFCKESLALYKQKGTQ